MIKFFRKIRQKLIDQNNVKNYLLYALGEIFLVVLGILIAIQVSNWNEDRIHKESASFHLGLLSQDLKEDKEMLVQLIGIFEENEQSTQRLLNTLKRLESASPILKEDIIRLQLEYNFKPRNSTLSVLVNTGEIGALEVESQNLISKYYRSLDAIEERDLITNGYIQNKLEPHIFDHYNYLYGKGNGFPMLAELYENDTRDAVMMDMEQFLSDKKLEALLVARLYQNRNLLDVYKAAIANLTELHNHINN